MKRNLQKMQTWYLVKYMPSGAWVGLCYGDSIQPTTSDRAIKHASAGDAQKWATQWMRDRPFAVEPMEFPA